MSGIEFNGNINVPQSGGISGGQGARILSNEPDVSQLLRGRGNGDGLTTDKLLHPSNETVLSDADGNLKQGVPLESVLNNDGTLKPGWSVDNNGVPKYSAFKARTEINKQFDPGNLGNVNPITGQEFHDPGFTGDYNPITGKNFNDPGFIEGDINSEPKSTYIVKDGKLVPNTKFEDSFNHLLNERRNNAQ